MNEQAILFFFQTFIYTFFISPVFVFLYFSIQATSDLSAISFSVHGLITACQIHNNCWPSFEEWIKETQVGMAQSWCIAGRCFEYETKTAFQTITNTWDNVLFLFDIIHFVVLCAFLFRRLSESDSINH